MSATETKAPTTGSRDSLPVFLEQMGRTPRISAEEEIRLAKRMHFSRSRMRRLAVAVLDEQLRPQLDALTVSARSDKEFSFEAMQALLDRMRKDIPRGRQHGIARFARIRRLMLRLGRRYQDAHRDLVVANLRLVVFMARRHTGCSMPLIDLVQEGNLGLMKAAERFEHERGFKFSTYAYWWIKQAIDRAIYEKERLIRLPVHLHEKRNKLFGTIAELQRKNGRRPSIKEIAERSGQSEERVEELLSAPKDAAGFDDLVPDEGLNLWETLPDPNSDEPVRLADHRELKDSLAEGLKMLEPREAEILRLRYGLNSGESYTLKEVGKKVRLSRERVRQIEGIALKKLRDFGGLSDWSTESASATA